MSTEIFTVSNIKCSGCADNIMRKLAPIPGVEDVQVDIAGGKVSVGLKTGTDTARLINGLFDAGYPVKAHESKP